MLSTGGRAPSSVFTRRSAAGWSACRQTRQLIPCWRGCMWWMPGKAGCRQRATSASWPMPLKSPVPQTNTCTRSGPVRHATLVPVTAASSPGYSTDRGALLDDVDHQPHPDPESALVEVKRRLMQVQLWTLARPHAQPSHRAGHFLQIPGEILAPTGLFGVSHRIRAEGLDGVSEDARRDLFVDHRRNAAVVLQGVLDAQWRQQRRHGLTYDALHSQPALAAGGADRARQCAALRNGVGGHARVDCAPHHHGAVARVDATRQHTG